MLTATPRFFRAPHKNQTVALKVTDHLIADLEAADRVESMPEFYRANYEAGRWGNKHLLAHLHELRRLGITSVNGRLADHVEAEERVDIMGHQVMVISSEDEGAICWRGPWAEDPRGDTQLDPTDLELEAVELTLGS